MPQIRLSFLADYRPRHHSPPRNDAILVTKHYAMPASVPNSIQDDDNFSQAGNLYRTMNDDQKNQLARNTAAGLSQATPSVQERIRRNSTPRTRITLTESVNSSPR
jgi:catalase